MRAPTSCIMSLSPVTITVSTPGRPRLRRERADDVVGLDARHLDHAAAGAPSTTPADVARAAARSSSGIGGAVRLVLGVERRRGRSRPGASKTTARCVGLLLAQQLEQHGGEAVDGVGRQAARRRRARQRVEGAVDVAAAVDQVEARPGRVADPMRARTLPTGPACPTRRRRNLDIAGDAAALDSGPNFSTRSARLKSRAMIEVANLTKRYGDLAAVQRRLLHRRAGPDPRLPRPERRRQDHHHAHHHRLPAGHVGHGAGRGLRRLRAVAPRCAGASATCPRTRRSTPT